MVIGIDIGSTTAKVVVLDASGNVQFAAYRRHHAAPLATLIQILGTARQTLGACTVRLRVTGSAGMGLCERFRLPFVQEVVATAEVVRQRYPMVRTVVDIGGEDAKLILLHPTGMPDIRMNGSCAGGTGAFIDQMATLLQVSLPELDRMASQHTTIYPIASRCGVFAKTDLQNLMSREIDRNDIAASIFHAVALQVLATLARGYDPTPQVILSGGPLTFLPTLRATFIRVMGLQAADVVASEQSELLPALGAALAVDAASLTVTLDELITRFQAADLGTVTKQQRLSPLFTDAQLFQAWQTERHQRHVPRVPLAEVAGQACFVGIDSGSTTTKLVVVDALGRVVFTHYGKNGGNPIGAVQTALEQLRQAWAPLDPAPAIMRSAVTGYGEDLIRAAFGCDVGMVETLAHYRAARAIDPAVSFILDIGGQDMKAIFIQAGRIQNIEINESCSSGCGSFIETFAGTMGYGVADFAQQACTSTQPCDLGTRCTVFMNSKVKQAQREGAAIADIAAGLAYSVIKNALHKVLKITNPAVLGGTIMVQGGTFRNPAVHRAIEVLLEQPVICPDIAELMGGYGAALTALDQWHAEATQDRRSSHFIALGDLAQASDYQKKFLHCRGCTNRCTVTKLVFRNGELFYTGNRCERIYSNSGTQRRKGTNLLARKYQLLFDRPMQPTDTPILTFGVPRVLNMYEKFPFWCTLLRECGFAVRLSDASSNTMYEQGVRTVASENICFPAKLTHGHIFNLMAAGVDRIFYPMITYEKVEFANADNTYNCPIVTGYPEVMRSIINPEVRHNIPLDRPVVTFQQPDLLKQGCYRYLKSFGVSERVFTQAFARAVAAQAEYKAAVRAEAEQILHAAQAEQRMVALLLCRPYHIDTLINHRVPDILVDFGIDVITEDAVPLKPAAALNEGQTITQWEYTNRYFHAAHWAGPQAHVEVIQLNSFGCGPDVLAVDEVKGILSEYGKGHLVLRIDEIESIGSARLRLRSMVESVQGMPPHRHSYTPRPTTRTFTDTDKQRTILVPEFSHFTSIPIVRPLRDLGYRVELLPRATRESVDLGLTYVNNEICYPAIIIIGDIIKALRSGNYPLDQVAVGVSQTGGQCRDSCYLTLLRKALVANGFAEVPVVSIASNFKPINQQPGWKINYAALVQKLMLGLGLTDALSQMYHAVAARELERGQALHVANHYMQLLDDGSLPLSRSAVLQTIRQAVTDFNAIPVRDVVLPRVAIVGEIYLKLNWFGNNHVAQWLMDQGIEVVIPPLTEYFTSSFINWNADVQASLRKRDLLWGISHIVRGYVNSFLRAAETALSRFRFYRPTHTIDHIAHKASEVIDLTNHFGEGWLIPGEIGSYVEEGVNNILCIQPFGCIANHVVAKGIEKRMRERYPQLNVLYLDIDAGTSEVNLNNRLYFFVHHVQNTERRT